MYSGSTFNRASKATVIDLAHQYVVRNVLNLLVVFAIMKERKRYASTLMAFLYFLRFPISNVHQNLRMLTIGYNSEFKETALPYTLKRFYLKEMFVS